jgi:hypothetical protein
MNFEVFLFDMKSFFVTREDMLTIAKEKNKGLKKLTQDMSDLSVFLQHQTISNLFMFL